MKISKEILKKIIKEELEQQTFGKDTVSRTDVSKDLRQRKLNGIIEDQIAKLEGGDQKDEK